MQKLAQKFISQIDWQSEFIEFASIFCILFRSIKTNFKFSIMKGNYTSLAQGLITHANYMVSSKVEMGSDQ